MDICKLCDQKSPLCDSHIVPEFLFEPLYDNKHKMMGINGLGAKGAKPLQKGIREKLFCEHCECFLNDSIEKPFLLEWKRLRGTLVPASYKPWDVIRLSANYKSIKLLTLSVLYRCSVSTLPTFLDVKLGPHEIKIKNMLLVSNPGDEDDYPLTANLILNKGCKPEIRYISKPVEYKEGGHRMYGQIYGGFMWWHKVSSHRHMAFRSFLSKKGFLEAAITPLNEIGVLQMAKVALRK